MARHREIKDHYREDPAIGGTDIRAMVTDFEAWSWHRKLKESEQTPVWLQDSDPTSAQEFGTMVHLACLEPWAYDAQAIHMTYTSSFATTEGRKIKQQALAQAKEIDGFVVRAEHTFAIDQIRTSFREAMRTHIGHDLVVTPQQVEIPVITHDQETGVRCKGKIDLIHEGTLYDLKTISDWRRRFEVVQANAYHVQLAHYDSLMPSDAQCIIFVESVPPYRAEVHIITFLCQGAGMIARSAALRRYADVSGSAAPSKGPF